MEKLSLYDADNWLYVGDDCEIPSLLEASSKTLCEESEEWKVIISCHIKKVLQSEKFLKIENFGKGLEWLNTSKPLLSEDLKDRVIVLDFFTYCCINCEHALPFLQEAEGKFDKDPALLIIGVHSPKFPNEKSIESVKNAVLRNKIKHPVINDPDRSLWTDLGVYCWPTVLILGPDHRVLFSLVGEMQIEKLTYLCGQTIDYFKLNNINLNKTQLALNILDHDLSLDTLLYPSGISAYGDYIMVSDTGHNRLLLLSYAGEVLYIIGNGVPGNKDGYFESSSFNSPHGTAWWKTNFVFVADTGNHSIRMIDLNAKCVTTFYSAQAIDDNRLESVPSFSSPWDVCFGPELGCNSSEQNVLYIAVAGCHQIWAVKLEDTSLSSKQYSLLKFAPFAGNGKEECRNNLYKMKAGFAQPSGINFSNKTNSLFVADSESSTIRSISLIDGSVKSLVGGGLDPKDLFQFGDIDGISSKVKLQHPLGICVLEDGRIFITDTYNHKIKLIHADTKVCKTVAGSGNKGHKCETPLEISEFDEPSAICHSPLKRGFLVVDTNNHCIKFFDEDMKVIEPLPLKFTNSTCIDGPTTSKQLIPAINSECNVFYNNSETAKIKLACGGKIYCSFKLQQTELTLTNNVLQPWNLSLNGDCNWNVTCMSNSLFDQSGQPSLILKCNDFNTKVHYSEVVISTDLTVCDNIHNICLQKNFVIKLDVEICSSGVNSYNGVFLL